MEKDGRKEIRIRKKGGERWYVRKEGIRRKEREGCKGNEVAGCESKDRRNLEITER